MADSTRKRRACRSILALRMFFSLTRVFGQTRVRMSRQPLAVVGVVYLTIAEEELKGESWRWFRAPRQRSDLQARHPHL